MSCTDEVFGKGSVRHPGRPGRDVHFPARAPGLVRVVLIPPRRLRLGNILLLVGPGNAQVSDFGQVSAAYAVAQREVIGDLIRPRPAHRRARRPGLLARIPLLLLPLGGTPLFPGRRPAPRQVIDKFPEFRDAARRAASSCSRSSPTSAVNAAICPACSRISASRGSSGASDPVTHETIPETSPGCPHDTPPAAQP
jgi:hypothetical protein